MTLSIDEELAAEVRMSLISGIGPRLRHTLLDAFGSAQAVLAARRDQLQRVRGVGPKLCDAILSSAADIDVDAEIELCRTHNITILRDTDESWPRMLDQIHDPPGVLFLQGELQARDMIGIGVVGTRHATSYGLGQAERLAMGLVQAGLTVTSGLARGIDTAAHRAAIRAGGRTIAIIGSGLLKLYPPENDKLAAQIAEHGAVISEAPPRRQPMSGAFPQRNRLISGLTLGVLVVEAPLRSGAMITARHAMEQGREVFAVPGPSGSRTSAGCHALIRDGAKLVDSVEDIVEELGPLIEPMQTDGHTVRRPAELSLNDIERKVLDTIEATGTSIDEIIQLSELPAHRVLSTISVLEVRQLISRVGGNRVVRK